MDVANFASKRREDENDTMGFVLSDDVSAATPEEKLLHSYDRFYKAISKVTHDVEEDEVPLPSLDTVLEHVPTFPASHLETLKSVWQRAEGFCKLQKVVGKFHDYRSDIVRRLKRRSRLTSESTLNMTNVENGMKEVLQKQTSMEQQIQFSNALLVGMEQRYEQIPALMEETLKKSQGMSDANEQTALGRIVNENRRQIQRMEEMMENLDARLRQWAPKEKEISIPRACWPETVHNNIVYCSSERSSTIDPTNLTAPEEEALPRSAVAVPQSRLPESQLLSKSKAMDGMSLSNVQRPVAVPTIIQNGSFEEKTCEPLQESILTSSSSVLSSIPLSSTSHPDDHFSSSANKLCPYSLETVSKEASPKETCTETAVHGDDEITLNEAFHEAFLKDVLLVQENIMTSALGNKTEKKVPGRRTRERHRSETPPSSGVENHLVNNDEGDPVEMLVSLMGSESISFLSSSFSEFCCTTAPSCPVSILPNSTLN